jgi:hypothetical protein
MFYLAFFQACLTMARGIEYQKGKMLPIYKKV